MLASGAISEIALTFVTNDSFDAQLNKSLAVVGTHFSLSRCYLFIDSADGKTMTNTHEWCAEEVSPQIEKWQNVAYSSIPVLRSIIEKETVYAVNDVASLPDDLSNLLEAEGIRSIVIAPLRVKDQVRGFLGFDECSEIRIWSNIELETLKTISGIIASAYSRKLLSEQLSASAENFRSLFNTIDDIILIGNLEGKVVFANEAASRKLGYSMEDLQGIDILDLHPVDKRNEAERILNAMLIKELDHCPLELISRDGKRIPVETRVWFGQWYGQESIFGFSKDLSAEQSALQKFERLFRSNPAAMAVSTVDDNRFVDVNESFLKTLGYVRNEVIGLSSKELNLFIDDGRLARMKKDLLLSGKIRDRELDIIRKDGSIIHGLFSGDLIDSQGQIQFLSVMIDMTAQVNLQGALEKEHDRIANIIESTRLGTWEWNIQTGETIFNDRWAEIVGYTIEELSPTNIHTWELLTHPDDLVESDRLIKQHIDGFAEYYECECRMRHKNGSWVWVSDRGKVIERDSEGRPLKMYGIHADITEKKLLEEQIHELAIRDPLTEVYNRRYILSRLEEFAAEYSRLGRNFCITVLDIDFFKSINDRHGHLAGDFILKEFAHLFDSTVRQYDLFGRYGGEEFIVVSANAAEPEAGAMIERVYKTIRGRAFIFEGTEIYFTFSAGLADSSEFQRDAFSVQEAIALADKRLYQAKAEGRDRYIGPREIK